MQDGRQRVITLDVEGVLMPEVWIELAELTGIAELRRTTRDEPDYDVLMQYRLRILAEHDLTMSTVAEVLAEIKPLDGARDFLDELRNCHQVLLLSDTFEQYACAMMPHLGLPTIFCHRLVVDDDRIVDYQLRTADHKRKTVEALQGLNFHVTAGGDSFNDLSMLNAADAGSLFHAPRTIAESNPHLADFDDYGPFLEWIQNVDA
ncbi:MAG: bifunctional phosphoserine phosphatase/homoserine phosphotransferase ThrH [Actinomycetota bacterium]